jgi:hypothetical protein
MVNGYTKNNYTQPGDKILRFINQVGPPTDQYAVRNWNYHCNQIQHYI